MAVTCNFEYKPLQNPIVDQNSEEVLEEGPSELLTVMVTGMEKELTGYF
jgi:hypothetical protein